MIIDRIKAELAAYPDLYAGKTAQQITDIINTGWTEVQKDKPVKTPIVDAWGDPVLDADDKPTYTKTLQDVEIKHDATVLRVLGGLEDAPNQVSIKDVKAAL